jgi:hypothetical protein
MRSALYSVVQNASHIQTLVEMSCFQPRRCQQRQYMGAVGQHTLISGLSPCLSFMFYRLLTGCIQICSGCTVPTCIPLARGLHVGLMAVDSSSVGYDCVGTPPPPSSTLSPEDRIRSSPQHVFFFFFNTGREVEKSRGQVAWATKFCRVAPNICGF